MGCSLSKSATLGAVDFGEVIGNFKVKYIGSVPVKASTGNDIIRNATERLVALKIKAKPIELKVTTSGLYLIDAQTSDVVKEVNISHVTFVAQDAYNSHLVNDFSNMAWWLHFYLFYFIFAVVLLGGGERLNSMFYWFS